MNAAKTTRAVAALLEGQTTQTQLLDTILAAIQSEAGYMQARMKGAAPGGLAQNAEVGRRGDVEMDEKAQKIGLLKEIGTWHERG